MHELSIAEAIIAAVIREKNSRNLDEIATIGVKVGVLSGVLPEALQFSFEMAVEGTPLCEAKLLVDHVPARGRCLTCTRQFEIDPLWFKCPDCGSDQIEILSGWELDIAYLEVGKESDGDSDFD